MIWIIIAIVLISLIVFAGKFNKDNEDLNGQTLYEKFKIVTDILNDYAFDGVGQINELHKRSFNLGAKGSNQLVNFDYGGGNLTLTWKYKYFQKEVINKKFFPDVRNLSIFEQERIAGLMIDRMSKKIENHKNQVLSDI
jgi:hypothetical protein